MNEDELDPFTEDNEGYETHCPECSTELNGYDYDYQHCSCGWQNPAHIELPNNADNE